MNIKNVVDILYLPLKNIEKHVIIYDKTQPFVICYAVVINGLAYKRITWDNEISPKLPLDMWVDTLQKILLKMPDLEPYHERAIKNRIYSFWQGLTNYLVKLGNQGVGLHRRGTDEG